MIAATVLIAIAATDAQALHLRARRGIPAHPLAVAYVRCLAMAAAALAVPVLLRALWP